MAEGVEWLLRDKTRPSRIPLLSADVAERVVKLTLSDPPGEATHWTGSMMVKICAISASAVRRIWRAHGLQPHRIKQFKLSIDPKFAEKLHDIMGAHAVRSIMRRPPKLFEIQNAGSSWPLRGSRLNCFG